MTPHQRFRQGNTVVSIAVRKDKASGEAYSRITDTHKFFPGASLFSVNGVFLNYLEDEEEQEYEPKRIAHYPDHVIDVVVPGSLNASTASSVNLSGRTMAQTGSRNSSHPTQLLTNDGMELSVSVSNLSLRPYSVHTSTLARPATYSLERSAPLSLSTSTAVARQTISTTRSMTTLSAIASNITHIQQQLTQSTDQQSNHHQTLLQQLFYMVQQQNEMLKEQAASKEREEQMLREQAESKLRDEKLLRMQQETIDRLIVAQQRIEAILVQNYELHEYPIPRLFVILPDSYEKWDPRNIMAERFRLFFLCECGDHCNPSVGSTTSSGQLTITATASSTPVPVRGSVHLAKHEGYELSRPKEFFDRYGPYVLGMLRMLKHCLAVATVAAPAIALVESGVKDVMDGVKSISERTIMAVDMSINFLEQKLDENVTGDGISKTMAASQEEEDMFSGLTALEGADLRRLDSFLRKKDADKILGNLYRITLETGHVKWVCLHHYRQVYRETAMASFLQCVETNGGTYDPQFGKVTITLKSSTATKDFFSRLSTQAPAVTGLRVMLDWSFGSTDLVMLVDKIAQSNIQELELNLMELDDPSLLGSLFRPGKGRYHSLLGLLSNDRIRRLAFVDVDLIGPRTSSLPKTHRPSLLQSFHYSGYVSNFDDSRLAEIISLCPGLADVRLGSVVYHSNGIPKVDRALGSLSKMKILHRCRLYDDFEVEIKDTTAPYGAIALRELTDIGMPYPTGPAGLLEAAIQRSAATLEVLILYSKSTSQVVDLAQICDISSSTTLVNGLPFVRLTHLELLVYMTTDSLDLMAHLLPSLSLVHLGVSWFTCSLLSEVSLVSLRSLRAQYVENSFLDPFYHRVLSSSMPCQIQNLWFYGIATSQGLANILADLPLRRLHLQDPKDDNILEMVLPRLDLSQLQVLIIDYHKFGPEMEAVLAARSTEFTDGFVLQLDHKGKMEKSEAQKLNARESQGSMTKLPRHRIRVVDNCTWLVLLYILRLIHYPLHIQQTAQARSRYGLDKIPHYRAHTSQLSTSSILNLVDFRSPLPE
ncbi:hypothetical protein KI688_000700 [Linnemannia hyalina]|uniref:Uncharacterized protein n=1 Tax=Linnemannia hyalina TaxID=64524 RepID=A0A9P7Y3Z5_9FUNG|nr:hypothetical protein KI688_000700 [Linnemannia hyalina]